MVGYAMSDAFQQFREALAERGIVPPADLLADGTIHRCDAEGRGGKGDAAYLLHLDGVPAGGFENWRDGLGWENWRADMGRILTPAEQAAQRMKIEAARREREAQEARRRVEARERACLLWAEAEPCNQHGYLTRKAIAANGARMYRGSLVLPIRDTVGVLQSLQFIDGDGGKRYLTGGRIRGNYFGIGEPDGVLCIAEGFATGASIHEATGHAVAVAFDCGNLLPVAEALREKYHNLRLIICADDDIATAGNPGRTKAEEAARAVGGLLAVPDFGPLRPSGATDFNDAAVLCGLEAVRRALDAASVPTRIEHDPGEERAPVSICGKSVNLVRASDIQPERVVWLWDGWLAAGKFHVLGGAPGTGKTTLALALASTVTTGGRWPDGTRCEAGNVLVWSGEDDPADTLVPRLTLSGADLSRVYFLAEVADGDERRPFDPARDVGILRRKLDEIGGAKLLIVDPIVSAVAGDSHKNAEVRRSLQPLADLAAAASCGILGITHFTKGTGGRDPVERLTGSLAFGALARVVLVAAKCELEDDGRTVRLFLRAKSNLGPDDGGFEYELRQDLLESAPGVIASCVAWGDPVAGAARGLLATAEAAGDDGEGGTLAEAKRFLRDLLEAGPMRAGDIFKDADQAGYSKRSIQRAANALAVDRRKDGMRGGWTWRLPPKMPFPCEDAVDAEQKALAPLAESSLVEVEI